MPRIGSEKLRQNIAIAVMVILGGFLFFSLRKFVSGFLGSVIFYIITYPVLNFFVVSLKIRRIIAVLMTLILSFLIILIPLLSLSWLMINKVTNFISNATDISQQIHVFVGFINKYTGINIISHENIAKLEGSATKIIPDLLGQTASVVTNILIMYFILYYLLSFRNNIEKRVIEFLPYEKTNAKLFTGELMAQTYANVIGAPLIAVILGGLAAIGFWIFGLDDPIFWGFICGIFSYIPLVGTSVVWIPAGLIQLLSGEAWQGTGILIYGVVIIAGFDHLIRFIIQKKFAAVHPIITLFGVIIGVHWFGLPGFIFGPLLISYFLIMFKVYKKEYGNTTISVSGNTDVTQFHT